MYMHNICNIFIDELAAPNFILQMNQYKGIKLNPKSARQYRHCIIKYSKFQLSCVFRVLNAKTRLQLDKISKGVSVD